LGADTSLAEHLQAASREEVAFEELYVEAVLPLLSLLTLGLDIIPTSFKLSANGPPKFKLLRHQLSFPPHGMHSPNRIKTISKLLYS